MKLTLVREESGMLTVLDGRYHIWKDRLARCWRWAFRVWTKQDCYGIATHGSSDSPNGAALACAQNHRLRERVSREVGE